MKSPKTRGTLLPGLALLFVSLSGWFKMIALGSVVRAPEQKSERL
jgi:hypothetical protein